MPAPLNATAALSMRLGGVRGGSTHVNISGESGLRMQYSVTQAPRQWARANAKTRQREKAGLTMIRPPPSGVQGGGSHVSHPATVLCLWSPALPLASDAAHVATQDGVQVPLSWMARMTGPNESVATSSLPIGRVPGASYVNVAGGKNTLLPPSAASDAAHAATQDGVHGSP